MPDFIGGGGVMPFAISYPPPAMQTAKLLFLRTRSVCSTNLYTCNSQYSTLGDLTRRHGSGDVAASITVGTVLEWLSCDTGDGLIVHT